MDPKSVEIGRGAAWFGCGWQIFVKNPGVWVLMAVVVIVAALVLSSIPFGALVLTLIAPLLAAGFLYGVAELKAGRPLEFAHLWQGFRDQAKFTPLIALGAVMLGAWIVSLVIFAIFIGGTVLALATSNDAALAGLQLGAGGLIAILLILTVHLFATAFVYFAVPLVMFRAVPAGAAMRSSLRACVVNVLPLFIFSLIYLVVGIVATIPFGLGWLVLLPWSAAMLYCSFEDIYPA
jgi:hypothetical protein